MQHRYRDNIDKTKNLINFNKCLELINKNIKFPLGAGKQGKTYKIISNDCGSVVLKEYYISKKKTKDEIQKNVDSEQRIMKFFTKFVEKDICPNFVKLYYYNRDVPYIVMEYADNDATSFFKDDKLINENSELYDIFLFQVLIGILCIHTQSPLYHRDLKPANILYKHIDKNIIFNYKINNKDYWIPTFGFLFMISDFGIAGPRQFGYPDIIDLGNEIIKCYSVNLSNKFNNFNDFINELSQDKQLIVKKEKLDLVNSIIFSIKKQYYSTQSSILQKIQEFYKILTYDSSIIKILDKYFYKYTKKPNDADNIITFIMEY